VELLKPRELIVETHASGTNIEGALDEIPSAVRQVREVK
jgi:uncharacterized protein YqgV (UPF0045/DUF77 family)